MFIKPASTRTAGILVLFSTTRFFRTSTPRFLKPTSSSWLFIFLATSALRPVSLNTKDSTPEYWLGVSEELRCIDINRSAPELLASVAFLKGVSYSSVVRV